MKKFVLVCSNEGTSINKYHTVIPSYSMCVRATTNTAAQRYIHDRQSSTITLSYVLSVFSQSQVLWGTGNLLVARSYKETINKSRDVTLKEND